MATVAIGRIESIEGSVEVIHADGTTGTLARGATVYADDAITTDGNSSIRIRFHDGSDMNIDPESSITLNNNSVNPDLIPEDDSSSQVIELTGYNTAGQSSAEVIESLLGSGSDNLIVS